MNLAKIKWAHANLWRLTFGFMVLASSWKEVSLPNGALTPMMTDGLWFILPILLFTSGSMLVIDSTFSIINLVKPNKKMDTICDKMNRWRLVSFLLGIFPAILAARYAYTQGFGVAGGTSIFYLSLTTCLFVAMIADVYTDNARQMLECKKKTRSKRECSDRQ